jgi:hypothetical protein
MEEKISFSSEIGRILRDSRDIEINSNENIIHLAISIAVKLHLSQEIEDRSGIGRLPGPAFSQDHRRMRFGKNNLMKARNSRST